VSRVCDDDGDNEDMDAGDLEIARSDQADKSDRVAATAKQ
jgi:hypothetical protein